MQWCQATGPWARSKCTILQQMGKEKMLSNPIQQLSRQLHFARGDIQTCNLCQEERAALSMLHCVYLQDKSLIHVHLLQCFVCKSPKAKVLYVLVSLFFRMSTLLSTSSVQTIQASSRAVTACDTVMEVTVPLTLLQPVCW